MLDGWHTNLVNQNSNAHAIEVSKNAKNGYDCVVLVITVITHKGTWFRYSRSLSVVVALAAMFVIVLVYYLLSLDR